MIEKWGKDMSVCNTRIKPIPVGMDLQSNATDIILSSIKQAKKKKMLNA